MCGDSSDNIAGIRGMGIKRFLSIFPELKTEHISVEQVKNKCEEIFQQDKNNKLVANLLTGVTKYGVLGEEFFDVNNRIVSLEEPFLTDEAVENINLLINEVNKMKEQLVNYDWPGNVRELKNPTAS